MSGPSLRERLYLFSSGSLKREHHTIRFDPLHGGRPIFLPVEQVREILVFGEVDLNKRFLEFLSARGILLHFFNRYGWYVGTFYPREHQNAGLVVVRQVEHYLNPEWRLRLAKAFVKGAIWNMRQVLVYYERRGVEVGDVREYLEGVNLEGVKGTADLMALEGRVREAYWRAFDRVIEGTGFAMGKRERRPPSNEVNALVSFGNGLLYAAVLSEIYRTHLDPRIGFLHETNFRRFTLHLDVSEVFKPVLVERTVLSLLRRKEIQEKHFRGVEGGIYLNEGGRRVFVEAWEKALRRTLMHRRLKRKVSYRQVIRLELLRLEKHFVEGVVYEPFRLKG